MDKSAKGDHTFDCKFPGAIAEKRTGNALSAFTQTNHPCALGPPSGDCGALGSNLKPSKPGASRLFLTRMMAPPRVRVNLQRVSIHFYHSFIQYTST